MKQSHEIQGWFNYNNVFNSLVNSVPDDGVFVECGAWLGKSSSYLCDISKDRIRVYIVDHWLGSKDELNNSHKLGTEQDIYQIFIDNMGDRIFTPLRMDSEQASKQFEDNSCDVVFIDMGHSYEEVKRDIELWLPKVKTGGIIAGHDYPSWPGVKKAVDEKFDSIKNLQDCWIKQL